MKLEIGTRIRVLSDGLPYYRAGEVGTVVDPSTDRVAALVSKIGGVRCVWVQFDREKTALDDAFWSVELDNLEVLHEV